MRKDLATHFDAIAAFMQVKWLFVVPPVGFEPTLSEV